MCLSEGESWIKPGRRIKPAPISFGWIIIAICQKMHETSMKQSQVETCLVIEISSQNDNRKKVEILKVVN